MNKLLVLLSLGLLFLVACSTEETEVQEVQAEEEVTVEEVEVDLHVSFVTPLFLKGLGPRCSADIADYSPWCHHDEEGTGVKGETPCKVGNRGPFKEVQEAPVPLYDGSGTIIALGEIRDTGTNDWGPTGQPSCRFDVHFEEVPQYNVYVIEGDFGKVVFSLDDIKNNVSPPLTYRANRD